MGLKIDTDKLQDCLGELDMAEYYIERAEDFIEGLKIPNGFGCPGEISNVKNIIIPAIASGIDTAKENVNGLIQRAIDAESKNQEIANFGEYINNIELGQYKKMSSEKLIKKVMSKNEYNGNTSIKQNNNYSNGNTNANVGNVTQKGTISNEINKEPDKKVEVSNIEEPEGTIEFDTIYNEKITQTGILDYVSDETKDAIRNRIESDYENQKVNIEDMTNPEFYKYVLETTGGLMTTEEYFTVVELENNTFGASQTTFIEMETEYPEEYERIKNILMSEYGFSEEESKALINKIGEDTTGEYATDINTIIQFFRNDPASFKEIFGYDLYIETEKGQVLLNDKQLMVDYYNWATNEQAGNNVSGEKLEVDLNAFLQSKSENLSCEQKVVLTNEAEEHTSEQMMQILNEQIENGKSMSITLTAKDGELLQFVNMETSTINKEISNSYTAKIIGTTEDGIIVSADGQKSMIGYGEILEDTQNYKIINNEISFKE